MVINVHDFLIFLMCFCAQFHCLSQFLISDTAGSVLASPMDDKLAVLPEEPISPPSPTSPDSKSRSPSSPTSKEGRFKSFKKRLSTGTSRPKSLSVEGEEAAADLYEQKYRQVIFAYFTLILMTPH